MDNLDEVLKRTVDSIRSTAENDDVIGKPYVTPDGTVIMSVNKLSYGFVVGGGEYGSPKDNNSYPYSAVSGGGVTLTPVGFLICGREKRFVSVDKTESSNSKWIELFGSVIDTIKKD